jgi:hypothetical protein
VLGFVGAGVVAAGVGVVAVLVDVSVVVVCVSAELSTAGALVSPGTVSAGAVFGSGWDALLLPPPQAARNGTRAIMVSTVPTR